MGVADQQHMSRFTYDDIVRIRETANLLERRGERAWVVAVIDDRERLPLPHMPAGVVYTVEFKDGCAVDVHEDDLEHLQ